MWPCRQLKKAVWAHLGANSGFDPRLLHGLPYGMSGFGTYAAGLVFGLSLAANAVTACPAGRDASAELVEIVKNMRAAPSEASAQGYVAAMWTIWLAAPDAAAQALLDKGMAFRNLGDLGASRAELTLLIDACPNYPEGYNQRAFTAFLDGRFEDALLDLDIAIDFQPVHLGALTGKVLTLIELGRNDEAQVVLRSALEINPWLAERALLSGPLEQSLGEDI